MKIKKGINIMAHFAIGQVKENETQTVFTADTLEECLLEWIKNNYSNPEYFIDVWEKMNGTPFPIADIKFEDWISKIKKEISDPNFMSTEDAFEIVYGLAEQNALDGKDSELKDEADRQELALRVVSDFLANNVYN
jgi:hypothetical protein